MIYIIVASHPDELSQIHYVTWMTYVPLLSHPAEIAVISYAWPQSAFRISVSPRCHLIPVANNISVFPNPMFTSPFGHQPLCIPGPMFPDPVFPVPLFPDPSLPQRGTPHVSQSVLSNPMFTSAYVPHTYIFQSHCYPKPHFQPLFPKHRDQNPSLENIGTGQHIWVIW